MFILPPNCIVPSATSLTMRPEFPSFLYFISHTPCGRSGRHQIDTFESTWPGQNWALTEWPVNVGSGRLFPLPDGLANGSNHRSGSSGRRMRQEFGSRETSAGIPGPTQSGFKAVSQSHRLLGGGRSHRRRGKRKNSLLKPPASRTFHVKRTRGEARE